MSILLKIEDIFKPAPGKDIAQRKKEWQKLRGRDYDEIEGLNIDELTPEEVDRLDHFGLNACDKCGIVLNSERDLIWTEYMEPEEYARYKDLRAYVALCDTCLARMEKKKKKIGEDMFKPTSAAEKKRRGAGPANLNLVREYFGEESEVTPEEVRMTENELKAFKIKEQNIYYDISGGSASGDFANIEILNVEEDEDEPVINFKFTYGNDMDRWNQSGNGRYFRTTGKWEFD